MLDKTSRWSLADDAVSRLTFPIDYHVKLVLAQAKPSCMFFHVYFNTISMIYHAFFLFRVPLYSPQKCRLFC